MIKDYCDRCGEEIKGTPLKMLPTSVKNLSVDERNGVLLLKELIRDKVFCRECIAMIIDFAVNKNTCDECVERMMAEAAMLHEMDSEDDEKGSGSHGEPDPREQGLDITVSKDQSPFIKYMVPKEEIVRVVEAGQEERQNQSGQYAIPLQPINPELIQKYQNSVKIYGVPKKCVNLPVLSSNSRSEDI